MSRPPQYRRAPRPQPIPGKQARPTAQPTTPHALANLRTARTLRLLTDLLRRLRTLATSLTNAASPVSRGVRRLQGHGRRLQVAETVQLGEKRFVAILRVDGEQFLIGGSATSVSLLATLAATPASLAAESVRVVAPSAEQVILTAPHPSQSPASFSAILAAQHGPGDLA